MNKNLSVLLIEDDVVDQMAFTSAVAKDNLPYDFEIASTVAEARRALTARSYDVILTDYKLPDGNAFDLLDVLLSNLVIFTTGSGDEEIAIRALRMGIRDYLIKDPDRHYLKMLPHRIEISRRQWLAEQQLRASEERHRDFVENATDMIQLVAPDGRIQFANRAWLRVLGYTESEVAGLSIFDVIHPDSREHCTELLRRVLKGETISGIQAVMRAKDGRSVHVEGNANCRFENAVAITTRGIFHDITERKLHEAERERLITELRAALDEVKLLAGLLPICAWCKKIRDDSGYWEEVSAFFQRRANVTFTHGMCPDCAPRFLNETGDKPPGRGVSKVRDETP